jgi:outer membrane protein assembly factor BamE (lipoprotein component of BamABCDE complex)
MNEKAPKGKTDGLLMTGVILFLAIGFAALVFIQKVSMPNFFSKSEITLEKVQKVKKGMEQLQVRSILGAPEDVGIATMQDYEGAVDFYQNSKKDLNVNVIFKNSKVDMVTINQDVLQLQP